MYETAIYWGEQYQKTRLKMTLSSPDPEWKKGSAELLVLSLLEAQPRHGYDISKLIQTRSGGALRFHVTSLYPLLHRLEKFGFARVLRGHVGHEIADEIRTFDVGYSHEDGLLGKKKGAPL